MICFIRSKTGEMNVSLLDPEPETKIPELRFPRYEPFETAIFECKIFNRCGCLMRVIPARRIREVLNEVYTEPTYRERLKGRIPGR